MPDAIACPRCEHLVDPLARVCGNCGVNLALAAAQAELVLHETKSLQNTPIAPEILVPRLGDSLVEMGVLSTEELEQALNYQRQEKSGGRELLIGQALHELGLVDQNLLDQAVTLQIMRLQNALHTTNRELEARVEERTRDLKQALDKLAELNQLKANFIANISHELRTPLTHIKGYLDILADDGLGPLNSDQHEAIATLQKAESRLETLIEDLIQFSFATQGELNLNINQIDLNELVKTVVKQARQNALNAKIKFRIKLEDHLPPVLCDWEKISWVLSQLIDNALKFTPIPGFVGVETFKLEDRSGVAVIDTGIGIAPDRIKEIFEPFHQLDSSATRRYGGTGLGLAFSQRILQAHKSNLEVQSVEKRGSRFCFSLPQAT